MDNIITYDFSSVPTIKAFCNSNKLIKLIIGPVGSGKSSGCVIHLLKTMTSQAPDSRGVRNTRYAIIRNTTKMLHDTTRKTIESWIPKHIYIFKEAKNKFIFNFRLPDNTLVNSEWLLRALDDEEQIRDLLSLELSGAWINEAREIDEEVFKVLRTRIGRFPAVKDGGVTYPFIIMDTNPPHTEHWLYHFFEVLPNKDSELAEKIGVWKQPSGLSPEAENIPNLPKDYYQNLMIGQDEDFIRVYIHGEYGIVKAGRAVFSAYKDSVHCAKDVLEPIKVLPVTIGMDFGLYPACVFVQFLPSGRLFVLDELISHEPTDIDTFISERLLPMYMDKYRMFKVEVIGDMAGASRSQVDSRTCFSVLRSYGFEAFPAYTNNLHDRIKAVNFFLTRTVEGKPAFQLSPNCSILRKGFNGEYHFRRLRVVSEKYAEVPEKNIYSHVMDALQYACLSVYPNFKSALEGNKRRYVSNQLPANFKGFI